MGGWGALTGALLLGPRLGKIRPKGEVRALVGRNMPLAAIGVFLLWFGWYGFNGGSVLSASPGKVSSVFVTMTLGAAAAVVAAMLVTLLLHKRPDLTMVLNGALAGLVGITAGADALTPGQAILVGGVAGLLVVAAIVGIDRAKIDDPVGAVSVHLVCGMWGTLAVGLLTPVASVLVQLAGIAAVGVTCFVVSFGLFYVVKKLAGLRVSEEEEHLGVDLAEHGMEAYPGFSMAHGPAAFRPLPAPFPLGPAARELDAAASAPAQLATG